jgi:hypothetical protein
MFSELLQRPDVGCMLLEILSHISVEPYCSGGFFLPIMYLIARFDVINSMSVDEIELYICHQLRLFEEERIQNVNSGPGWTLSVEPIIFGFHNVLLRFEYEPYMANPLSEKEIFPRFPSTWPMAEERVFFVIDNIIDFLKNKKR